MKDRKARGKYAYRLCALLTVLEVRFQFLAQAVYIQSKANSIPDCLSRLRELGGAPVADQVARLAVLEEQSGLQLREV